MGVGFDFSSSMIGFNPSSGIRGFRTQEVGPQALVRAFVFQSLFKDYNLSDKQPTALENILLFLFQSLC